MGHYCLNRRAAIAAVLACGLASGAPAALAQGTKRQRAVERFVEGVAREALSIIVSNRPDSWKKQKFRNLAVRSAHVRSIALFSLGRFAGALPRSLRKPYFRLVEEFIAGLFVTHLETFKGESVEITGTVRHARSEFIVKSRVRFADGRTRNLKWRVIVRRGRYWIFDVQVQGIWLAILQRSTFVSMIRKVDGNMTAFIRNLRQIA